MRNQAKGQAKILARMIHLMNSLDSGRERDQAEKSQAGNQNGQCGHSQLGFVEGLVLEMVEEAPS
jgi:hypothetical protein